MPEDNNFFSSAFNSIADLFKRREEIEKEKTVTDEDRLKAIEEYNNSRESKDYELKKQEAETQKTATAMNSNANATAAVAETSRSELAAHVSIIRRQERNNEHKKAQFKQSTIKTEIVLRNHSKGNAALESATDDIVNEGYNTSMSSENRKLYDTTVKQIREGKAPVLENINLLKERLADDPEAQRDFDQFQRTIDALEVARANYADNPAVVSSTDEYSNQRQEYADQLQETENSKIYFSEVLAKTENYHEEVAKLAGDDQEIADRARIESGNPDIRVSDDLEAGSFATSNKQLLNALTGKSRKGDANPPFYFQVPTLTAITDFRLRNGYSPYAKGVSPTDIARDAVHINIFSGTLGKTDTVTIPDTDLKVQTSGLTRHITEGSFTIYPNDPDWMTFSHTHIYKEGNFIADAANSILGSVNTLGNAVTGLGSLTGAAVDPNIANTRRRVDTIDEYQTSEKQSISVPFVLFTKGDFIRDIYRPLMFLTALSYPSRLAEDPLAASGKALVNNLATKGRESLGVNNLADIKELPANATEAQKREYNAKKGENTVKEAAGKSIDFMQGGANAGLDFIGDLATGANEVLNAGAFRYIIAKRPEFLSVRHASGLFNFKLAVIENFTYTFKGPWINSIGDIINYSPDESRRASSLFNTYLHSRGRTPMPYAFPSIAECSMKFKNVEPVFREDYLALMLGASDFDGSGLVRVSEKLTGTNSERDYIDLRNDGSQVANRNNATNPRNGRS